MKVALCTTCKGRLSHLRETLPVNLESNADLSPSQCVHVVLDYNSRDGMAEWIRQRFPQEIDTGRLVYYRFTEPTPFRMAHAKNLAHRLGIQEGADILVNMDADNFNGWTRDTGSGFGRYLLDTMREPSRYLWAKMVKTGEGRLPRGISGRIAVTKQQFWLSGGYDERYNTWSPDDKDFNERLGKLGFQGKEIDPQYLQAITHNDQIRFREYEHATEAATGEDFDLAGREQVRVVNQGRIGLGTVYRNFQPQPLRIEAVPTRVFGIGMHKTATTSLAKALTRLGYPCAHWPSAHWAKQVYQEMTQQGTSYPLEKVRAATDLPLTLLFRELDKAYPGSKFILTTRNEGDWLRSVEKHFSPSNPFYAGWDNDPFTNRVHQLLYGRKRFDAEIFLARYRRHNTEVREYFRQRPEDLLEINLSEGAGWYELAGFLYEPLPSEAFPWENRACA